jgi:hypothetical protein
MTKSILALAAAAALVPVSAHAAPGLGSEVYGAEVEQGELELETIYGALSGGPEGGEDALVFEAGYGLTDKFRLGVRGEFEKEPGKAREFEALGIEGIYELGKVGDVSFAIYGEYEIVFEGADKIETKLLVQHKRGPLDLRFNLIAEKHLEAGEKVELEYAASADVEAIGEVRLGVQAYGQLGTISDFLPRAEHFAGPVAKVEVEGLGPEIEIEAGYLFALGAAKDETDGQVRLMVELEF